MATKGQNKRFYRRIFRSKEKQSTHEGRDTMMGRGCRRGWGRGIAK